MISTYVINAHDSLSTGDTPARAGEGSESNPRVQLQAAAARRPTSNSGGPWLDRARALRVQVARQQCSGVYVCSDQCSRECWQLVVTEPPAVQELAGAEPAQIAGWQVV